MPQGPGPAVGSSESDFKPEAQALHGPTGCLPPKRRLPRPVRAAVTVSAVTGHGDRAGPCGVPLQPEGPEADMDRRRHIPAPAGLSEKCWDPVFLLAADWEA